MKHPKRVFLFWLEYVRSERNKQEAAFSCKTLGFHILRFQSAEKCWNAWKDYASSTRLLRQTFITLRSASHSPSIKKTILDESHIKMK